MIPVASRDEQWRYHGCMEFLRSSLIYFRVALGYVFASSADYKDDICDQPRMRLPLHWRRW